jgi:Oxidoreductase NAD-binding domain
MGEGFFSRGFRGRRRSQDTALPPGQYLEDGFPVLSAGPTPRTPLEEWDFSIVGQIDEPRRWTWEEFRPLPSEEITRDIHSLMAMIRHRAAAGSDVPSRLLCSSRSYEEIVFREELETLASRDSALEVIHTLTRSRPEGWTGYDRRVDAEMLREVAWSPDESPLAFVCGPTSFVEGVADALVSLGHDPARVKTERFGPTGG